VRAEVLPGDREAVRVFMDIALIDTSVPLNLVFDVSLEPQ
jgi:hypothetical protein